MRLARRNKRAFDAQQMIKEFSDSFGLWYGYFYNNDDAEISVGYLSRVFDDKMNTDNAFNEQVIEFSKNRNDFISSDRECAAAIVAWSELTGEVVYSFDGFINYIVDNGTPYADKINSWIGDYDVGLIGSYELASLFCPAMPLISKASIGDYIADNWEPKEAKSASAHNKIDRRSCLSRNEISKLAMEKRASHGLNVGDILVGSYGYDARITEFYQVTRVSDKSVWVREIDQECTPGNYYNGWNTMPVPDKFVGEEMRKVVKDYDGRPFVSITPYLHVHLWDGEPEKNYDWH